MLEVKKMVSTVDLPKDSNLIIIFDLLKEVKWPVLEYLYARRYEHQTGEANTSP